MTERDLFIAALQLEPAERPSFLERECLDDPDLRRRVEGLLAAHERAGSAFGASGKTVDFDPQPGAEPPAAPRHVAPGAIVAGRYKLREIIGEGGMGSVYLAEQTQPIKRHVALKLIKAGMDSRTVMARFESERQALALMDHPNIAKVLDAGTTEQGRPFFVMELVKGIPLTDYCDLHRLGLPQRLNLFRQICSAVQHAHQKGIIHRDLKPTNLLVENHDDIPVPKVIDFGLAKAITGLQLTEHSLYSAFGTMAGTPLYMAPEQAKFNALDIDTRADIYALGVILYELLTGSTPIPRETMKKAAIDEMLRLVREVEPPIPSNRIGSSATLPSLAASRHIDPSRLGRFVRGDLDWIVMKALAKERQRRYDSAIALGQDIERFVNHEPVTAGPPSARYRFKKFVRRNRGRVIAASLVMLALIVGVVGTTLGLIEARRQRNLAVAAVKAESKARSQAEKRLDQVEKANTILGSIFKDMDPFNERKGDKPLAAILGERLDQATTEIESDAIGDPLTVARMQITLGESLLSLSYPEKAMKLFTKARATFTDRLGPNDVETLISMNDLAMSYDGVGKFDRAISLFEEALTRMKANLPADHVAAHNAKSNLALSYVNAGQNARAVPIFEENLAAMRVKFGPDAPATLRAMNNLAAGYHAVGQYDRALPLYEETLILRKAKLGPNHTETLISMSNLADAYRDVGKFDKSLALHEQTLALRKSKHGPDHLDTFQSMNGLASAHVNLGQFDRGIPLFEETIALEKAKLGHDHPMTLATMSNLANAYREAGKLDQALTLQEQVYSLEKATLGVDHPSTITSLNNVANAHFALGHIKEALRLCEESFALVKAKRGIDHPVTLQLMGNLGVAYWTAKEYEKARPLLEQALALQKVKLGADNPDTLVSMRNIAALYKTTGKGREAIPILEEVLSIQKSKLGADHQATLVTMQNLAATYQDAGMIDRAIPLYEATLALAKSKFGADHPSCIYAMLCLPTSYEAVGRLDEAAAMLEENLRLAKSKYGSSNMTTLGIQALLVRAQLLTNRLHQARLNAAEFVPLQRNRLGANSTRFAGALDYVAREFLKAGQFVDPEPLLRECLAIREKAEPDAWTTFNTKSMLGGSLLGQMKYEEAASLLLAGYEGMKNREKTIPPDGEESLTEALERLVQLLEATNKPDDAAKWRKELEDRKAAAKSREKKL